MRGNSQTAVTRMIRSSSQMCKYVGCCLSAGSSALTSAAFFAALVVVLAVAVAVVVAAALGFGALEPVEGRGRLDISDNNNNKKKRGKTKEKSQPRKLIRSIVRECVGREREQNDEERTAKENGILIRVVHTRD